MTLEPHLGRGWSDRENVLFSTSLGFTAATGFPITPHLSAGPAFSLLENAMNTYSEDALTENLGSYATRTFSGGVRLAFHSRGALLFERLFFTALWGQGETRLQLDQRGLKTFRAYSIDHIATKHMALDTGLTFGEPKSLAYTVGLQLNRFDMDTNSGYGHYDAETVTANGLRVWCTTSASESPDLGHMVFATLSVKIGLGYLF